MTVTGTVMETRPQADGDLHIKLTVDNSGLLNEKNHSEQHGSLVVELMCVGRVTQRSAKTACRGFSQGNLFAPLPGQRIRVTGAYVLDKEHGWMEIHPVTAIDLVR